MVPVPPLGFPLILQNEKLAFQAVAVLAKASFVSPFSIGETLQILSFRLLS